jgi:16S rRNA (uracil1498-N3)-methyltransferase
VLRLAPGDTVSVFDGRGHEFLGRIAAARRCDVSIRLLSRVEPIAEPGVPLTLVQAVLKAEKMDDIVRDAVMLGVAAIQPIISKRAETTVAALVRGARLDRWRRIALASVKQSRRAVLPEIRTPLSFETYLEEPRAGETLMFVEPAADRTPASLAILRGRPFPHDAAIIVGPEGGWTDSECAAAGAQNVRLVTLGPRTLRADAVPLVAISVLQFLWEA